MNNLVYLAMYNPMIHESTYGVISVHKTKRGAEMALEFHKKECDENPDNFNRGVESWAVFAYELKD